MIVKSRERTFAMNDYRYALEWLYHDPTFIRALYDAGFEYENMNDNGGSLNVFKKNIAGTTYWLKFHINANNEIVVQEEIKHMQY
jgi:hypothetical protein